MEIVMYLLHKIPVLKWQDLWCECYCSTKNTAHTIQMLVVMILKTPKSPAPLNLLSDFRLTHPIAFSICLFHNYWNTSKTKLYILCSILFFLYFSFYYYTMIASQVAIVVKNTPASVGDAKDMDLIPESGRFPWRRKCQPIPVFLPGKSHGQKNLASYSP